MSRYIDADALTEAIARISDLRTLSTKTIGECISDAPSIDIVRCKECKHWTKWGDGEMFCGCLEGGIGSDADDFCSYGERNVE